MSNICRRCGYPIHYDLVPLKSMIDRHCHFCIREFKELTDKLDKERNESLEVLKKSLNIKHQ